MELNKAPHIEFINADCMEIMKGYADKQFDFAIVDPPYGIARFGNRVECNHPKTKEKENEKEI